MRTSPTRSGRASGALVTLSFAGVMASSTPLALAQEKAAPEAPSLPEAKPAEAVAATPEAAATPVAAPSGERLAIAQPAPAIAATPVAVTVAVAPVVEVKASAPATPAAAAAAAKQPTLVEALVGGKIGVGLRYRYEYLDREDLPKHARLSTLRVALGYETKPLHGFSVYGQFEGVTRIGPQDWKLPTNDASYKGNQGDNAARPLAAEPVGNEINQAYLKYASPLVTVKLGRQEVSLNNARFISVAPWRQGNQTMDAANLDVAPVKGLNLNYVYIAQANRVVGQSVFDGQLSMHTHVGNLTYKKPGLGNLAVFNLYLDYRKMPGMLTAAGAPDIDAATGLQKRMADGSTNTTGLRVDGPYKLSDTWGLLYAVDYAHQVDIASNPLAVAANYYNAELGAAYKGLGLRVQYNVRGGTTTPATAEAFQTPLAHTWDGWVENFLRTPKAGLRLVALHLAGPLPWVGGLSMSSAYFEYFAQVSLPDGSVKSGDHYGREVDFGLEYKFVKLDPNWTIGARVAYYSDDKLAPAKIPLAAANLRTSAYTTYAF